jgi:plasmid rolling circle replication initiator protein Rep
MFDYTNDEINAQADKPKIDIEKHRSHKMRDIPMSASFERLGLVGKAVRIKSCGTYLEFKLFENGSSKLVGANFCKVRLCSMCAWRRSLKVFGQVSKIMDHVQASHNYRFIFLTLTQKNVPGDKLTSELDRIFDGFNLMTKRKEFKAISKGFFRSLEVTHNWERDDYHPHIHMVIAVNKSYFKDKAYIGHARWMEMWRDCMGLDYDPSVDVRTVKPDQNEKEQKKISIKKAIAEVAKYSVKSDDYIHEKDTAKTDAAVMVLDTALANRRLFAFGGKFREIHKKLNLDAPIDGNLAETHDEIRPDLTFVIVKYRWHGNLSKYIEYVEKEPGIGVKDDMIE